MERLLLPQTTDKDFSSSVGGEDPRAFLSISEKTAKLWDILNANYMKLLPTLIIVELAEMFSLRNSRII